MEGILLIIICFGFPLLVIYVERKYNRSQQNKNNEEKELISKFKQHNQIPEDAETCICKSLCFYNKYINGQWKIYLWKSDNILYFCGITDNSEIKKSKLYIKNIEFYNLEGSINYTSLTEGGGINFINAFLFGIFGIFIGFFIGMFSVGMGLGSFIGFILGILLGGRERVKTKENKLDNRETYLNYIDESENKKIVFNSSGYEILSKLIPNKDKNYIMLQSNNSYNKTYEDIEKLAELNKKGILTDNEFLEKKQLLLNKIK